MKVNIQIELTEIRCDDLRDIDDIENHIINCALEAAGHAILAVDERRLERLVRFCQTGKFD